MAVHLRLSVCGLLVCLCVTGRADDELSDQERMQGNWEVIEFVDDGNSLPKELLANWSVKFTGNTMTIVDPGGSHEAFFKLDPSSQPKRIDAIPSDGPQKGKTIEGIYELQDGRLKICLPNKASNKRPSEFAAEKGADRGLAVLNRASK